MIPTTRQPGRCIYCAFRARQYSLQVRRLPFKNRNEREKKDQDNARSVPIRYHEGKGKERIPKTFSKPDGIVR